MNPRRFRALGQPRNKWYSIARADAGSTAEVFIYDEIDSFWGVSAGDFVKELAAITADEITVRINSPGGNAFDGIAIMNALRGHKARIVTVVEGLAASAASLIAVAGDEVIMRPNTEMMVHNAWAIVIGEAADMRKMADDLDRMADNMADIYASKAGGTVDEWRAVMTAETWYTADEAVTAGLADRVENPSGTSDDDATTAKARFDLSMFAHAGRRNAPTPQLPRNSSAPVEVTEERTGDMALLEDLRKRVGVADDADEATTLEALDEALRERAESETTPAAASLPDGVVAIDAGRLATLEANNTRFNEFLEQQRRDSIESQLSAAIGDGRITPAHKETWRKTFEANATHAAELLASMPANTAVPVTELGHSTETNDDVRADATYKNWSI